MRAFPGASSEASKSARPEILHAAIPRRCRIEEILACCQINLGDNMVLNPDWIEGEDQSGRYLTGQQLFEKLIKQGWVALEIGWIRDDERVNYSVPATVKNKLIAVMAMLK